MVLRPIRTANEHDGGSVWVVLAVLRLHSGVLSRDCQELQLGAGKLDSASPFSESVRTGPKLMFERIGDVWWRHDVKSRLLCGLGEENL